MPYTAILQPQTIAPSDSAAPNTSIAENLLVMSFCSLGKKPHSKSARLTSPTNSLRLVSCHGVQRSCRFSELFQCNPGTAVLSFAGACSSSFRTAAPSSSALFWIFSECTHLGRLFFWGFALELPQDPSSAGRRVKGASTGLPQTGALPRNLQCPEYKRPKPPCRTLEEGRLAASRLGRPKEVTMNCQGSA